MRLKLIKIVSQKVNNEEILHDKSTFIYVTLASNNRTCRCERLRVSLIQSYMQSSHMLYTAEKTAQSSMLLIIWKLGPYWCLVDQVHETYAACLMIDLYPLVVFLHGIKSRHLLCCCLPFFDLLPF